MKFPLDWRFFKDTIHDWISEVVRDGGIQVVWREQNAPQPSLPFIGLKIIAGPTELSQSWGQLTDVDLTRAGKEIEMSTYVPAHITVSCQAFVAREYAVEEEIDAQSILAACRASLSLESVKESFASKRISFVRAEPIADLSALEETSITSIANLDIVFGLTLTVAEYVTYIQKVQVVSPQFGIDDIIET